jgi:sn-glycerol 3-phosphate transport system substrate-binding protein
MAQEPSKIKFWHAMSGSRGKVVEELVKQFNEANKDVQVVGTFKGSYAETLTGALAAARAGEAPHIVQVYEVGTRTILDAGLIVPLADVSKGQLDTTRFVKPILDYYTIDGALSCMPFNSSTAMLYYNKDAFQAAGLDPEKPPTTYEEMSAAGKKLVASGKVKGGLSYGWPAWIFEQTFAMHDQLLANHDNGRSGLATAVYFNSAFGVKVLSEWQRWAQEKVLVYGGREYAANEPFIAGEFAMLVQSTSSLGGIQKAVKFALGTAFLPRLPGYAQGNNVVGGGCLWTLKGFKEADYQGVWRFYQFLTAPAQEIAWHKGTGYFPLSNDTVKALEEEGWFKKEPNFLTAFDQILRGKNTPAAAGALLGDFVTIRDMLGVAIEDALVKKVDAKAALDKATQETNRLLADYASLNAPKK